MKEKAIIFKRWSENTLFLPLCSHVEFHLYKDNAD